MGLIYETDPAKAQALQSDVLLQSLATNPYFAASSIPTKNAKLATTKQDIIRAINEIVSNFSALKIATDTNVNKVLQALGDFTADTTLLDKLKAIDGNLIEALAKVNTTAQNASASADSAASRIEIVRQQIEEAGATFEDEQELTEDTNVVKLQYTPVDASKIDLYINGVKYGKKFFTYDADTNSITWINIGKYIGFDLEATDIITAIYSRRA
ncbi:MAG: hypothetical protein K0R90_1224 [Oscillospiraceae bacterium]|jgi:hypothetical protein|nr:hypothetical protein [Oscillospiraceae bacterium]